MSRRMMMSSASSGPGPAVFPTANLFMSLDVHDTGNRSLSGSDFNSITDPLTGNVLANVDTAKGALLAGDCNGYDAMRLLWTSGGGTRLWDFSSPSVPPIATSQTMVAVAKCNGFGDLFDTGGFGNGGISLSAPNSSGHPVLASRVGSTSYGPAPGTDWLAAYQVVVLGYDHASTIFKIWQNTTVFASPTVTSTPMTESGTSGMVKLGNGDFDWTFICLYNVGCDATMLYNIAGSLGTKYGITVA